MNTMVYAPAHTLLNMALPINHYFTTNGEVASGIVNVVGAWRLAPSSPASCSERSCALHGLLYVSAHRLRFSSSTAACSPERNASTPSHRYIACATIVSPPPELARTIYRCNTSRVQPQLHEDGVQRTRARERRRELLHRLLKLCAENLSPLERYIWHARPQHVPRPRAVPRG